MANVPVHVAHGVGAVQQLPLQHQAPAAAPLLPAAFPRLHAALTFSRHEVDALGGLHLFRADYVEHDVPAPAGAPNNQPPHDDMNPQAAVPHIADAAHD
jgi:hypothetical protein